MVAKPAEYRTGGRRTELMHAGWERAQDEQPLYRVTDLSRHKMRLDASVRDLLLFHSSCQSFDFRCNSILEADVCDHEENDSISTEKAALVTPLANRTVRVGGTTIDTWISADETAEQLKLDTLAEALGLVHSKTGIELPSLTLYLGAKCRCIAYMGESGGNRDYILFLGDQMLSKTPLAMTEKASGVKGGYGTADRGVADQRYDAKRKSVLNPTRWVMGEKDYQAAKVQAKAIAVIVHEMGHILHERGGDTMFWKLKTTWGDEGRPPANLAVQVSQYATKSQLEFVAEVFTGRVYGKHYAPAVMTQYAAYGGTPV